MLREELRLDNQLCFRVHRLSRLFISLYQPLLTGLGITYPQYLVMLVLWERESIDYQELAERLEYSTGTLTPVIQKLEQRNLVKRQKDPTDRRRTLVMLTPDGCAMRRGMEDLAENLSESALVADRERFAGYARCIDALASELRMAAQLLETGESLIGSRTDYTHKENL